MVEAMIDAAKGEIRRPKVKGHGKAKTCPHGPTGSTGTTPPICGQGGRHVDSAIPKPQQALAAP